jgi:hypothetical protein
MEKKCYAVVIGNGEYSDFPKLRLPAQDAHNVAEVFAGLGFEVNSKPDQTRTEILELMDAAMNKLRRGAPAVVVYYAGHGCGIEGTEYLIPIDGKDMSNPATTAQSLISVENIAKMLNGSRTSVDVPIILILDCYRMGVGQGGRLVGNMSDARGPAINVQISNIVILYSTVRTNPLSDAINRTDNGPFAEYFLKHLLTEKDVGLLAKEVRTGLFNDDLSWQCQVVFSSDNLLKPFSFEVTEVKEVKGVKEVKEVLPQGRHSVR